MATATQAGMDAAMERLAALEAENARLQKLREKYTRDLAAERARSARLAAAIHGLLPAAIAWREREGGALTEAAIEAARTTLADAPTGRWVSDEVVEAIQVVGLGLARLLGSASYTRADWTAWRLDVDAAMVALRAAGLLDEAQS